MNKEFPQDTRSWIPIYVLLEETGKNERLKNHLDQIIPAIEKDPSILTNYPINIETLKSTQQRLTNQNFAEQIQSTQSDPDMVTPSNSTNIDSLKSQPGTFSFTSSGELPTQKDLTDPKASQKIQPAVALAPIDWRQVVIKGEMPPNATSRVLNTAFANELEKHLALQVVALLSGDFSDLKEWHWKVWENPNEFGYSLAGKDRNPKDDAYQYLDGPLHNFMNAFAPVIARAYKSSFLIEDHLAARGLRSANLMRRISIEHPVLVRSGITRFKQRIEQSKFTFVHTPGLNTEVFFDSSTRCIHFDGTVYQDSMPTVLMHKICYHLWAVRLQYHVIPSVAAGSQIIPLTQAFLKYEYATPIERLKIAFTGQGLTMSKLLEGVSRGKIASLAQLAPPITLNDVIGLQLEMNARINRLILADSVDLIGLTSAIAGQTVTQIPPESLKYLIGNNPLIKDLVGYSLKLKP